jgi:hypothetical protein
VRLQDGGIGLVYQCNMHTNIAILYPCYISIISILYPYCTTYVYNNHTICTTATRRI